MVALPLFLLAWQVMIAAMMLPSSLPLVRMFARGVLRPAPAGRGHGRLPGRLRARVVGLRRAAFVFDIGVHAAVDSSAWLGDHDWLLGGSVLALAGAFQFTELKDACLDKCRHPGHFLIRFYERGTAGGFRLGARHGLFCLGCCWALMLVMFSVGVASLGWMAVLTAPDGLREDAALGRAVPSRSPAIRCWQPALPSWSSRRMASEPADLPGVEASEQITPAELRLATRNHGLPLEALAYDVTPAGLHYLLIHYDIPVVDAGGLEAERGRARGAASCRCRSTICARGPRPRSR